MVLTRLKTATKSFRIIACAWMLSSLESSLSSGTHARTPIWCALSTSTFSSILKFWETACCSSKQATLSSFQNTTSISTNFLRWASHTKDWQTSNKSETKLIRRLILPYWEESAYNKGTKLAITQIEPSQVWETSLKSRWQTICAKLQTSFSSLSIQKIGLSWNWKLNRMP